ncbi:DUF4833 domain-containing protein [Shimia sp.]|uniref:DUF4833 domain-containing protein n=1 Tax=Shimia sp. TaxID=1954381 RepID=UPI003296C429
MPLLRLPNVLMLCALVMAFCLSSGLSQQAQAKPSVRVTSSMTSAQLPVARKDFPHPTEKHQVFFLQRTANANTIVYVARFDDNGDLDKRRPLTAYWRRYDQRGQVMALRWYERVFGFGVSARANKNGNGYLIAVNAMRSHTFELRQTAPFKAALWTQVNNRDFELIYGFLDLDESGLFPKVDRLRLYSSDPISGRYVTHLIAVSGGEY